MRSKISVMCWNIAEGSDTGAGQPNSMLPLIAEQISSKSPDIVLLNEVVNCDLIAGGWLGGHVMQTKTLSDLTGIPNYYDAGVNRLGWAGHKAVSILSVFPLSN